MSELVGKFYCTCTEPYLGAQVAGTPIRCEQCRGLVERPTPDAQPLCETCGQPEVPEMTSQPTTKAQYSFTFDEAKNAWVCSIHGEVSSTGWIPCWNGCEDGYFDGYEDDPLWYDPGDMETCSACGGEGGWTVCGECNARNPDVEW